MSHTLLPDNSHAMVMFTLTQLYSSLANTYNTGPVVNSHCGNSLCVCVCGKNGVSVYFCGISLKSRHRYHTNTYTLRQHPAVMYTPHIHSLNSHPALWCVLYYSILPFTKGTHIHTHAHTHMHTHMHAHMYTHTHTHTHTHPLPGTVHLNMHSHLVHTDTAVIWHSGTIGLCFI